MSLKVPENNKAIGDNPLGNNSNAVSSKNYLLAIGIDKYQDDNFTNLNNAVSDAKNVVQILTGKYGFEDKPEFLLFDDKATRRAIISTLETVVKYFDASPDRDNLIVYFSGHGDYDKRTNIGYRIPVDAEFPHVDSYIEDSTILDRIKSIKAKHILLISDSCFSGSMIRGKETDEFRFEAHTERLPSRHIITSGLLQTVSDGMRDDYSPFARALITYLDATPKEVLPFSDVAQHIKHNVPQNANGQIPYYGTLDFVGNYGGEFILRSKKVNLAKQPFENVKMESEMIFVQGGTFAMGSNETQYGQPIHKVALENFYIGKYPVTQGQWQAVMGNNPSIFNGKNLPIENVSWNDAQEFLKKINEKTGKYYRLPTEAEWEYAALGGIDSKGFIYSGSNNINDVSWHKGNSKETTHEIGTTLVKVNELGICDMCGNVWEWCEDDWHEDYKNAPEDGTVWIDSPRNTVRVVRGGAYCTGKVRCRTTARTKYLPTTRLKYIGFRLACSSFS